MKDLVTSLLAGAVSGAASASLTAPLELVKTLLQCQQHPVAASTRPTIVATLREIIRQEGGRACFKGLSPTLAGIIPTWGIYFSVYESTREALSSSFPDASPLSVVLGASAWAGMLSNVVTNPLWVVKTRMTTQRRGQFRGIGHCFRMIYRQEGIRPFFAGTSASIFGVAHICVQFPLYESMKSTLLARGQNQESLAPVVIASSVSKIVSSVVTYPHEVVRARLQNGFGVKAGFLKTGRSIAIQEGIGALYAGMYTNLVKSVPSAIITFSVYEAITKALQD